MTDNDFTLQDRLGVIRDTIKKFMARLMPNEREQCEIIWKPVYEEYRRLGYRLKKTEQIKLF